MIGVGFSSCVCDIALGVHHVDEVTKIISGTRATTDDHWEQILDRCKGKHWSSLGCDPAIAEKIARQLLSEGKIEQPRLRNEGCTPIFGKTRWVTTESEVRWR